MISIFWESNVHFVNSWILNSSFYNVPKIKTEYARKSFRFMGAKIYNELPIEIRKTESLNDFNKRLEKHFIRTFYLNSYVIYFYLRSK